MLFYLLSLATQFPNSARLLSRNTNIYRPELLGMSSACVACRTETHTGHNYFSRVHLLTVTFAERPAQEIIYNKITQNNTAVGLGH